jgi:hypothetical protein
MIEKLAINGKQILAIAVLIAALCQFGGSQSWSSHEITNAEAQLGSQGTLVTNISRSLSLAEDGSIIKNMDSNLVATNAHAVKYDSQAVLTKEVNGETYTTTSSMSQDLTLPGNREFSVEMEQNLFTGFSDQNDPFNQQSANLMFWKDDDSELAEMFSLLADPNDSPNDIIQKFFWNFADDDGSFDINKLMRFKNFQYGLITDHRNSVNNNGMECVWGAAQQIAIDYSNLA